MAFTTTIVVILLSIIYNTWGIDNLALNKPARQINNYSVPGYLAGKAVNGYFSDFSHTAKGEGNKWWSVDLLAIYSIESITLYNRRDKVHLQSRLSKITILTSTVPSPADPSLSPSDWTTRNYRAEAYDSSGGVTFDPPIEAQHVAIYSENTDVPLALTEVQVFASGANHAYGKPAAQSSTYTYSDSDPNLVADRAVDGDFSTRSITNFNQPNNAWWKVDLVDRILLREVTVYVRDGLCGPSNPKVDCSSRLSDVYLLTNPSNTNTDPNTDGSGGWNICYHSVPELGNEFTRQCTTNNPLTRLFSIRTNAGLSVELREVYVFGDELPELSEDIALAAEEITTSSITITFSQWSQQMTGEIPPTQYTVASSGGQSKTVAHDTGSQRLSTTFNGLDTGQTYTFTVSCSIQGIACIGATPSITKTTLCAVPDAPPTITLTNSKETYDNRQMWKYIATWVAPAKANCPDVLEYHYTVTGQSSSTLQTDVTATFYLDGDLPFEFVVRAKNSKGYSIPTSKNGRSGVLIPFDEPRLELSFEKDCVLLHLQPPQIPNGEIISYKYWCEESDDDLEGSLPVRAEAIESGFVPEVCGLPRATKIVCNASAVNSVGESPKSTVPGYTNAAVLSSGTPQLLSPAQTNSELVVVSIFPVELEDSALQVSSYLVLLKNLTSTKVKRSTEAKCDIGRGNCVTVAEIDSELVTSDGYWFYIGDEKLYGRYVNSALVPKSSYSVQIVIYVQLPESGNKFYQTLNTASSFTAPSKYCAPPPTVANAIAGSATNVVIGEKVVYACEYGFQRTSGDNQLTCTLTDNYESVWDGTKVVCSKEQNWIVGVLAGIVAFVVLAVGIAVIVVVIKKRNQTPADTTDNNSRQSTELSEYVHPLAARASNYAELNFGEDSNVSNAGANCEYDTVDMDAKPRDYYETISAEASATEHVYASC